MCMINKENLIKHLKQDGIKDKAVLSAIEKVPRENFVPDYLKNRAYEDVALAVGFGQTISQPYTVAFMLQSLELKKGDKVLEIGTASGWNAALISVIVGPKGKVFTTEIIPELAESAKSRLKKIKNIKVIATDGSIGLKEYSPFDKIIVAAACPEIPEELISQLKENGILIAPVGPQHEQELIKIRKSKIIRKEILGNFIFVPLRGKRGY